MRWVTFEGARDGFGGRAVDARHFAVAEDEDEDDVLRVYDAVRGGKPVRKTNISKQISLRRKRGESDIEAATSLGGRAFWRSSHGAQRERRGGPPAFRGDHHLFTYPGRQGGGAGHSLPKPTLRSGNGLEAFFTAESNDEILLLSDDGGRGLARGKPCKKVKPKKR